MSEPNEPGVSEDETKLLDGIFNEGFDKEFSGCPEGHYLCDKVEGALRIAILKRVNTARAEGDQAGYERGQRRVASLFDAIAHGDEAHRAWLQQAIEDHFAGRFVQKPAGEGGYERGRREAIEECAKIAARYNDNRVATAIRALAEPAPQQASQLPGTVSMPDTAPRLEAVAKAYFEADLGIRWKDADQAQRRQALRWAMTISAMHDALRAFDQAQRKAAFDADHPRCPHCGERDGFHIPSCIKYSYQSQPICGECHGKLGDHWTSCSQYVQSDNATVPVMGADPPWLGGAIATFLACRPEGSDRERLGQRIMAVLAFANAQSPAAGEILSRPRSAWPDSTPEMQASSLFEAIWSVIKTWDIAVPEAYGGYCSATGNHVRAILDAINTQPPSEAEIKSAQRAVSALGGTHTMAGAALIAAAKARRA